VDSFTVGREPFFGITRPNQQGSKKQKKGCNSSHPTITTNETMTSTSVCTFGHHCSWHNHIQTISFGRQRITNSNTTLATYTTAPFTTTHASSLTLLSTLSHILFLGIFSLGKVTEYMEANVAQY